MFTSKSIFLFSIPGEFCKQLLDEETPLNLLDWIKRNFNIQKVGLFFICDAQEWKTYENIQKRNARPFKRAFNVTRFATLAIICIFRNLFDGLFSISETFQPTLAHFCAIWHFFIVLNGQKSNHLSDNHLPTMRAFY